MSDSQMYGTLNLLRRIRGILNREGKKALVDRAITSRLVKPVRELLAPSTGYWAARDGFADMAEHMAMPSPTIVDGGAYRGKAIDRCLEVFDRPSIFAFEPIPTLADELRARYADDHVRVIQKALGSENRDVSLRITRNILSSSILKTTSLKRSYHGSSVDVHEIINVEEVRLDEVIDGPVDILKLDLQGYELEALHGCGQLLDSVRTIMVEVEFIPLYEDQPLFADIAAYLAARDFHLFNLYEPYTERDGRLAWADALFIKGPRQSAVDAEP